MNTSFTPGPWFWRKQSSGALDLFTEDGTRVILNNARLMNQAANASLIAAAPMLYSCLQNLVARGLIDTSNDHYDEAIEALNLATGQEP